MRNKEGQMRREREMKRGGFTLLELLMVVIIIGILAAAAIPTYSRTVEKSRSAEAMNYLGALRGSELRFAAQQGQVLAPNIYTQTIGDLDVDAPPVGGLWNYSISGTVAGSNVVAARNGGAICPGCTIEIDLNNGATCASNPIYGLNATPC